MPRIAGSRWTTTGPQARTCGPVDGSLCAKRTETPGYSLSPAVIWVAESSPSIEAAASGQTHSVNAGWS